MVLYILYTMMSNIFKRLLKMTQVTASAIPADTLSLQDLQNTGVLKAETYNVVTAAWDDKFIDSAQDVEQFEKLYQQSLSNYKTVALVADFANNVVTEIAPKAGTIANTPRINPSLATCDNKFLHVEETTNPVNRFIASSGFYVMSTLLTEDAYAVKLENFVANDAGTPVVGGRLKTIINDHYKVRIAVQDPATAGVLRNFSVAFGANLTSLGFTGAVTVTLKQIAGTNASVTNNTAIISAVAAPNSNGFGSPLTIDSIIIDVVNRETDPQQPIILGANITVNIIS